MLSPSPICRDAEVERAAMPARVAFVVVAFVAVCAWVAAVTGLGFQNSSNYVSITTAVQYQYGIPAGVCSVTAFLNLLAFMLGRDRKATDMAKMSSFMSIISAVNFILQASNPRYAVVTAAGVARWGSITACLSIFLLYIALADPVSAHASSTDTARVADWLVSARTGKDQRITMGHMLRAARQRFSWAWAAALLGIVCAYCMEYPHPITEMSASVLGIVAKVIQWCCIAAPRKGERRPVGLLATLHIILMVAHLSLEVELRSSPLRVNSDSRMIHGVLMAHINTVVPAMLNVIMGNSREMVMEAESQTARAQAEAMAANVASEARRQFLRYVFHEVRVPMNSVVLGLDELRFAPGLASDQQAQADMQAMQVAAENIVQVLNDVLDGEKMAAGQFQISRMPMCAGITVRRVQRAMSKWANGVHVKLHVQLDPMVSQTMVPDGSGQRRVVLGDQHRIAQILSNFISNALKFTPRDGTGAVLVRVQVMKDGPRPEARIDPVTGFPSKHVIILDHPLHDPQDVAELARQGRKALNAFSPTSAGATCDASALGQGVTAMHRMHSEAMSPAVGGGAGLIHHSYPSNDARTKSDQRQPTATDAALFTPSTAASSITAARNQAAADTVAEQGLAPGSAAEGVAKRAQEQPDSADTEARNRLSTGYPAHVINVAPPPSFTSTLFQALSVDRMSQASQGQAEVCIPGQVSQSCTGGARDSLSSHHESRVEEADGQLMSKGEGGAVGAGSRHVAGHTTQDGSGEDGPTDTCTAGPTADPGSYHTPAPLLAGDTLAAVAVTTTALTQSWEQAQEDGPTQQQAVPAAAVESSRADEFFTGLSSNCCSARVDSTGMVSTARPALSDPMNALVAPTLDVGRPSLHGSDQHGQAVGITDGPASPSTQEIVSPAAAGSVVGDNSQFYREWLSTTRAGREMGAWANNNNSGGLIQVSTGTAGTGTAPDPSSVPYGSAEVRQAEVKAFSDGQPASIRERSFRLGAGAAAASTGGDALRPNLARGLYRSVSTRIRRHFSSQGAADATAEEEKAKDPYAQTGIRSTGVGRSMLSAAGRPSRMPVLEVASPVAHITVAERRPSGGAGQQQQQYAGGSATGLFGRPIRWQRSASVTSTPFGQRGAVANGGGGTALTTLMMGTAYPQAAAQGSPNRALTARSPSAHVVSSPRSSASPVPFVRSSTVGAAGLRSSLPGLSIRQSRADKGKKAHVAGSLAYASMGSQQSVSSATHASGPATPATAIAVHTSDSVHGESRMSQGSQPGVFMPGFGGHSAGTSTPPRSMGGSLYRDSRQSESTTLLGRLYSLLCCACGSRGREGGGGRRSASGRTFSSSAYGPGSRRTRDETGSVVDLTDGSPSVPPTHSGEAGMGGGQAVGVHTAQGPAFAQPTTRPVQGLSAVSQQPIWVRFEVLDNGLGIEQAELPKLFSAFVQIEAGMKAKGVVGTGLGLHICKELARLQGGYVTLSSAPGVGSCFGLELPFYSAQLPDNNTEAPEYTKLSASVAATNSSQAAPGRDSGGARVSHISANLPTTVQKERERRSAWDESSSSSGVSPAPEGHPASQGNGAGVEPSQAEGAAVVSADAAPEQRGPDVPPSSAEAFARAFGDTMRSRESRATTAHGGNAATRRCSALASTLPISNPSKGSIADMSAGLDVAHGYGQAALRGYSSVGSEAAPVDSTGQGSLGPFKYMSVLVVDDVPANRQFLMRAIKRTWPGVRTDSAANGREAVDAVGAALKAGAPYSFVTLDKEMPVMDGFEAARGMRNLGYGGPIIGCTGNALEGDQLDFMLQGADAVIAKPISITALKSKVVELEARKGAV